MTSKHSTVQPINREKLRDMRLFEHNLRKATVITPSGRFDLLARREFEKALIQAQEMGCSHVILDLEQVSYIDNGGLGKIVLAFYQLKERGIPLTLAGPQPKVRRHFERQGLSGIVPISAAVDEVSTIV